MSKPTWRDAIREWIGGWAFRVFLWSIRMTQDEYITQLVFEEELLRKAEGRQ